MSDNVTVKAQIAFGKLIESGNNSNEELTEIGEAIGYSAEELAALLPEDDDDDSIVDPSEDDDDDDDKDA